MKKALLLLLIPCLCAAAFGASLPPDIKWETNMDDPPIGDPNALKGGVFYMDMEDYPLTFRLMGPNSNDSFAGWNRAFTMDLTLVNLHPTTDRSSNPLVYPAG